ncbi:unnamed protein product [Psylliodes chrysocephalus]|uniref:DUF7083 domain-containing protein n=1 Tax=Psylliodes chrysocephalus TaxID=3402493 RepID=A0A9P0G4J2_9CUCU|nr:unnamed protein product [Psylliodes chrysocephala]
MDADTLAILLQQQNKILELAKKIDNVVSGASSTTDNTESFIESLAKNLMEFVPDLDNNVTFDSWFRRYEDLFLIDGDKLDDAARVQLLLRNLITPAHEKYINFILPKHPREYTFNQTVATLKKIFGQRILIFNARYKCFQISKSETDDFLTYAGIINKQYEDFQLNKLFENQFKCLMFVIGLKSAQYSNITTRLLSKIDKDDKDDISLKQLVDECHKILSLEADTALVEQNSSQVHAVINKIKNSNLEDNPKKPRTPCWQCGALKMDTVLVFKKRFSQSSTNNFRNKNTFQTKSIFINHVSSSRKFIDVYINDSKVILQFDSASDVTIIDDETWKMIGKCIQFW